MWFKDNSHIIKGEFQHDRLWRFFFVFLKRLVKIKRMKFSLCNLEKLAHIN